MYHFVEIVVMIFVTDLDKTLVYSKQPKHCCVEHCEGREVTYITKQAHTLLYQLLSTPRFHLIPCTLRSFEQTNRIRFITPELTPILICDNGFSIYHRGILDMEWDRQMQNQLTSYPNAEVYRFLKDYVAANNIPLSQIKSNRDAFYTLIFQNAEDAAYYASSIASLVPLKKYYIDLQGRKLYIIPNFLDKSIALLHIKNQMQSETIVTAGDSSVDENFVRAGDIAILPGHSLLHIPSAIRTTAVGIYAGEELLEMVCQYWIKENFHKRV